MKQLSEIMSYQNESVLNRFMDEFKVDVVESSLIFDDTKRWLYLCTISKEDIEIIDATLIIDKMWHNFILFTREYKDFCEKYLGKFIHHQPITTRNLEEFNDIKLKNPIEFRSNRHRKISSMILNVSNILGRDVAIRWFSEYPDIYSKSKIALLRNNPPQVTGIASQNSEVDLSTLAEKELAEVMADRQLMLSYCGGPSCGPYCEECRGGGGNPPRPEARDLG